MTEATIRLQPGWSVRVVAQDPSLEVGGGPMPGGDLGLGNPYPDQGLPGEQPRPDQGLPPFPSHPIVYPPEGEIPPPIEPPTGVPPNWDIVTAWTPVTGWIVVAVPTGNVPTPSRRK